MKDLVGFIRESNKIEGIVRDPTRIEIEAHQQLLAAPLVTVDALQALVSTLQPGARLREHLGMDVYVGNHVPPRGGPGIRSRLCELLDAVTEGAEPYRAHLEYETLHPFMDGNGRSGRALWLWMHLHNGTDPTGLGFLHVWYYETLQLSILRAGR